MSERGCKELRELAKSAGPVEARNREGPSYPSRDVQPSPLDAYTSNNGQRDRLVGRPTLRGAAEVRGPPIDVEPSGTWGAVGAVPGNRIRAIAHLRRVTASKRSHIRNGSHEICGKTASESVARGDAAPPARDDSEANQRRFAVNRRKRIRIQIGALALGIAGAIVFTSGAAAHMPMTITIRHQMRGCHAWSASSAGPYKPSLSVKLGRGSQLTIVDNDLMPHRLVQLSGPKVTMTTPSMRHLAGRAYMTFTRAGVYVFKTKAGEDYKWVHGMHTIGEDNVLRLKVTVS